MKEKATLKQIAAELNVSVSTVSKALNGSPEISEPTKIKIREYAKLRNYKPNVIGLNLKNRKTKTIGVIIPNILNPFFAKVFTGIEKAAEAKGYNVITCISNESLSKEVHTLEMLSNGTIDGFIVSISEEAQKEGEFNHFKQIINEGTPVVMFDRVAVEVDCDKVVVNDFESFVNATNHLIALNCRKIALLSSIDNLSVGKLRAEGYLKALTDNMIAVDEKVIIRCNDDEEFNIKLEELMSAHQIDGVLALDEHASTMALKSAIKNGYSIPDKLCVIGVADGVWSKRLTPSMTTISQHGPEIGEAAAKLLMEQLESNEENYQTKTIVIKTELRQRESTRRL